MNPLSNKKDSYLTPSELLSKYPALVDEGWSIQAIGNFRSLAALRGRKIPGVKGYEISMESFAELMHLIRKNKTHFLRDFE